jgi:hypothetical protein
VNSRAGKEDRQWYIRKPVNADDPGAKVRRLDKERAAMLRLAITDEMVTATKREYAERARRGQLVRAALDASDREPLRVRTGRVLVRLGGRLQGDYAHPAIRDAIAEGS